MRIAALVAACLVAAAVASRDSAPAARSACPYQAQVFVYGQNGWETLTDALAANQTPCANYYVVLTAIGDKTKPRGRAAVDAIHAKGPNFHALAEFNVGAWSKVKPASCGGLVSQPPQNQAVTSACRCSTRRMTRAAVSSIESSVVSITGQPSRLWTAAACSSSS